MYRVKKTKQNKTKQKTQNSHFLSPVNIQHLDVPEKKGD